MIDASVHGLAYILFLCYGIVAENTHRMAVMGFIITILEIKGGL